MKIKSIFGNYADRLQVLIDSNLDAFAPTWFQRFFSFDTPQMSLTFETAIGRTRIEAAASVIARGSKAPLRARPAIEKYSGAIPAIAEKFEMREEDVRNYMTLQALNISEGVRNDALLRLFFDDVRKTGESLNKRLDIMCLEAVSTGKITITIDNNPDGMVLPVAVDLLMASGNKSNAAINWATAATATPVKDIENVVQAGRPKGRTYSRVLMSDAAWQLFRATTEVKDYLKTFAGMTNTKIIVTQDIVNGFLSAQRLPTIEIVDQVIGVEKDGIITAIRPWEDDNVAFIPDGNLGVIKVAVPIEQMRPVADVSYANFNQGLISKWSENEPFAEFTKGELNAFPSFEAIDAVQLLSTTVAF